MTYEPDSGMQILGLSFGSVIAFLVILLAIFFLLLILRKFLPKILADNAYYDNIIFQVRLPKDKPGDQEKEFNVQMMREEIAKSETLFNSIGGMRAPRGIKPWLLGRNDQYSFEIIASNKQITFYVVAPRETARYIEQQINAHYPDASVEEVEDYNIFQPQGEVVAGFLKTKRGNIFPIKTYQKMDADPMNSLLNTLSKLDENESLAIQYLVRSAHPAWHKKSASVVTEVHKGKKLSEALKTSGFSKALGFVGEIAKAAKPDDPMKKNQLDQPKKLSAMEEEMLKAIEEKNSKAGLDVNIRVIISTSDKGRANIYLTSLLNAFTQFNYYEYGNSFKNKIVIKKQKTLIKDFIYRRFDESIKFLFNTEELSSVFHFPLKNAETPNILWLTAKHAPAPTNIPNEGIIIGYNNYRGVKKEIRIKREDRRRHMYIIGKSGVGKTQLISNMAIQDILNGEGICVLDPHGDLITDLIERIPPQRAEDVIIFAPGDISRPMALNLIEYDENYPEQKTFVINEMINIFDKLYDLKATGGPIFEQYMRNALLLIMSHPESGSTLMEVPKVLADPDFRNMKLDNCPDSTIVDFWRKEAEKAGGDAALANVVPYITSKLTQFISNDTMRPIIGQQKSSFKMRDVMDNQKILLVDLSKGKIGEMNAFLLGMILVGKILMSALSRADMRAEERKDFYLYIDEFQNFTTDSICSILSEARKYGLSLIIAHQYLGQLIQKQDTSIKDAVFGNAGTWVLLKIGSDDAEEMQKEFSPVFNQFDLINIEKFTAYVKLLVDNTATRPFSMACPWPLFGQIHDGLPEKIKTLSRLKYGQDRSIIEAEIKRRISFRE